MSVAFPPSLQAQTIEAPTCKAPAFDARNSLVNHMAPSTELPSPYSSTPAIPTKPSGNMAFRFAALLEKLQELYQSIQAFEKEQKKSYKDEKIREVYGRVASSEYWQGFIALAGGLLCGSSNVVAGMLGSEHNLYTALKTVSDLSGAVQGVTNGAFRSSQTKDGALGRSLEAKRESASASGNKADETARKFQELISQTVEAFNRILDTSAR